MCCWDNASCTEIVLISMKSPRVCPIKLIDIASLSKCPTTKSY